MWTLKARPACCRTGESGSGDRWANLVGQHEDAGISTTLVKLAVAARICNPSAWLGQRQASFWHRWPISLANKMSFSFSEKAYLKTKQQQQEGRKGIEEESWCGYLTFIFAGTYPPKHVHAHTYTHGGWQRGGVWEGEEGRKKQIKELDPKRVESDFKNFAVCLQLIWRKEIDNPNSEYTVTRTRCIIALIPELNWPVSTLHVLRVVRVFCRLWVLCYKLLYLTYVIFK